MNLTSINKPLVNIPESQKTREWAINFVDWCIAMSPIYKKNREQQLYDRYNGYRDANKFKHITNTYGIEFPAGKLKHVPLVRPLMNRLSGEQQMRPFGTIARADDTDAVGEKDEVLQEKILNDVIGVIRDSDNDIDDDLTEMEKEYHKFQMDYEVSANHVLQRYVNVHHIEQELQDCFTDKQVTGKEYFYCRVNRIGEEPEFKTIRPGQLFYADNNVKWVRQTDWAVHPVRMSVTEILDRWGEKISADDYKKLEGWTSQFSADVLKYDEMNSFIEGDDSDPWSPVSNYYEKPIVHFVEWKAIREVYVVKNPNKYDPDAPFIKHIPQDKLDELSGTSKKNLQKRYVQDLYQGVRIADDIYVDLGKVRYPQRDKYAPSKVNLSFDGLTFNGKVKPFSIIEKTEDLQDQYDILHWHKENLIAMSGVKGSYMEISQLPDFGGMTKFEDRLKKWMYYKKLGTAFIDRSRRGSDSSYNQFGTYDDTLGTGLQFILMAIEKLEETAERIIGVNRQRLGDISQYDGKGNTQTAVGQSNLTTAMFFNEHDEFARIAMEAITNACRISYKNGFISSYITSGRNQVVFKTDPAFPSHHYSIYFTSRLADERSIDELKAMAMEMIKAQKMEWEDLFPLFRKSNLIDIEQTIIKNLENRRRQITQQQQQMMELQQQLTVAREQAEIGELNAKIQKLQSDVLLNQAKAATEQQALELEKEQGNQQLMNEARRIDLEAEQLRMAASQKNVKNSAEVTNK